MADVIPFPSRSEVLEADCRMVDHEGVEWFKYAYEYAHDGGRWCLELWAKDMADAEERVYSMRKSVVIVGQLYADIDAQGDITVDAIVNAGGVMAQSEDGPTPAVVSEDGARK